MAPLQKGHPKKAIIGELSMYVYVHINSLGFRAQSRWFPQGYATKPPKVGKLLAQNLKEASILRAVGVQVGVRI